MRWRRAVVEFAGVIESVPGSMVVRGGGAVHVVLGARCRDVLGGEVGVEGWDGVALAWEAGRWEGGAVVHGRGHAVAVVRAVRGEVGVLPG